MPIETVVLWDFERLPMFLGCQPDQLAGRVCMRSTEVSPSIQRLCPRVSHRRLVLLAVELSAKSTFFLVNAKLGEGDTAYFQLGVWVYPGHFADRKYVPEGGGGGRVGPMVRSN